jgi:hypothetical protein
MSPTLTDTIFILVFILFVYCLYLQCSNNQSSLRNNESYNNYQSHQNYQTINNKCFDYVMTDGKSFYLYKVRKPYEKDENPLIFKSKDEVLNYLKKTDYEKLKCGGIQFVDITTNKSNIDPRENPEWQCSREWSGQKHKLNMCKTHLGNSPNKFKALQEVNQLIDDTEKNQEKCMFRKTLEDAPAISHNIKNNSNEIKFMNEINGFF